LGTGGRGARGRSGGWLRGLRGCAPARGGGRRCCGLPGASGCGAARGGGRRSPVAGCGAARGGGRRSGRGLAARASRATGGACELDGLGRASGSSRAGDRYIIFLAKKMSRVGRPGSTRCWLRRCMQQECCQHDKQSN
jgi:hypothetical protein